MGMETQAAGQPMWSDEYPELGKEPIPVEPYISPEYFELEREKVFKRVWLKVGRDEEIPEVGDFKVKRIPIGNTSVILVRGEDRVVRGFHNVCAHRGNKIIWGDEKLYGQCGKARGRGFSCHFHGWSYNLRGELVHVPCEDQFFNFDKSENGLVPVACDVWEGFIFINLDPKPTATLKEYLDEQGERLAGYPYSSAGEAYTYYTVLNCNWKIAQDAFSEGYHVPTVHAGSFPWADYDAKGGEFGRFGIHAGISIVLPDSMPEPTPVARTAFTLGNTSIAKAGERTTVPPRINRQRHPRFTFEVSLIFPNFLVHLADGFWFTHQFWPLTVDKTLWEGVQYFMPPRNAGERFSVEFGQVLQRNAWLEDTGTMEATYSALSSGVRSRIHLQDAEALIRHSYKVIEEFVRA